MNDTQYVNIPERGQLRPLTMLDLDWANKELQRQTGASVAFDLVKTFALMTLKDTQDKAPVASIPESPTRVYRRAKGPASYYRNVLGLYVPPISRL